jgi:hypothetical protein
MVVRDAKGEARCGGDSYGAHQLGGGRCYRGGYGQADRARYGPWALYRYHHRGNGGSLSGGVLVGVIGGSGATSFDVWSLLVAAAGAIALLYVYGLLAWRTA